METDPGILALLETYESGLIVSARRLKNPTARGPKPTLPPVTAFTTSQTALTCTNVGQAVYNLMMTSYILQDLYVLEKDTASDPWDNEKTFGFSLVSPIPSSLSVSASPDTVPASPTPLTHVTQVPLKPVTQVADETFTPVIKGAKMSLASAPSSTATPTSNQFAQLRSIDEVEIDNLDQETAHVPPRKSGTTILNPYKKKVIQGQTKSDTFGNMLSAIGATSVSTVDENPVASFMASEPTVEAIMEMFQKPHSRVSVDDWLRYIMSCKKIDHDDLDKSRHGLVTDTAAARTVLTELNTTTADLTKHFDNRLSAFDATYEYALDNSISEITRLKKASLQSLSDTCATVKTTIQASVQNLQDTRDSILIDLNSQGRHIVGQIQDSMSDLSEHNHASVDNIAELRILLEAVAEMNKDKMHTLSEVRILRDDAFKAREEAHRAQEEVYSATAEVYRALDEVKDMRDLMKTHEDTPATQNHEDTPATPTASGSAVHREVRPDDNLSSSTVDLPKFIRNWPVSSTSLLASEYVGLVSNQRYMQWPDGNREDLFHDGQRLFVKQGLASNAVSVTKLAQVQSASLMYEGCDDHGCQRFFSKSQVISDSVPPQSSSISLHDDDDDSSAIHFTSSPTKKYAPLLGHDQFVYPLGTKARSIREDKVASATVTYSLREGFVRDFYDQTRALLQPFNIDLCSYDEISSSGVLLLPTPDTCTNFSRMQTIATRTIFTFMDTHKDILFATDIVTKSSIVSYASDRDDLGFLQSIVRLEHPALVEKENHGKSLLIPPIFGDPVPETIYTFVDRVKRWKRDLGSQGSGYTDLSLVKHVLHQLRNDYRNGTQVVEDKILKHCELDGNASLPAACTMTSIVHTILSQYTREEQKEMLGKVQAEIVINSMTNRGNYRDKKPFTRDKSFTRDPAKKPFTRDSSRSDFRSPPPSPNRSSTDRPQKEYCKECGLHHSLTLGYCAASRKQLHIAEYLKSLKPPERSQMLKDYRENSEKFVQRFTDASHARGRLRRQVNVLRDCDGSQAQIDAVISSALDLDDDLLYCAVDHDFQNREEITIHHDTIDDLDLATIEEEYDCHE